jgi:hypothetical protein
MLFPQVIMTSLAFSVARNCSVQSYPEVVHRIDITPPTAATRITVEQDFLVPGTWGVRVETNTTRRLGLGPIRFPAVTTKEALEDTLNNAWGIEQRRVGAMAKCFTRLREPASSCFAAQNPSSSRSASPQPPQTDGSPRSSPRRV